MREVLGEAGRYRGQQGAIEGSGEILGAAGGYRGSREV